MAEDLIERASAGADFMFTPSLEETYFKSFVSLKDALSLRVSFQFDPRGITADPWIAPQMSLVTMEKMFSVILRWKNKALFLDLLDGNESRVVNVKRYMNNVFHFEVVIDFRLGIIDLRVDGNSLGQWPFSSAPRDQGSLILGLMKFKPGTSWMPPFGGVYSRLMTLVTSPGSVHPKEDITQDKLPIATGGSATGASTTMSARAPFVTNEGGFMALNPHVGDPFGGVTVQSGQGNGWWYNANRDDKQTINATFEKRYPGRTLAAQRAIKLGLQMAWDERWTAYRAQAIAKNPNTPMVDVYDAYFSGQPLDAAEGPKPGYHSSNPLPTTGEYASLYRPDTQEGAVFRDGELADIRFRPIWFQNQNPVQRDSLVEVLVTENENLENRVEELETQVAALWDKLNSLGK